MSEVTFVLHPRGRHRTHLRNTMRGWVEEREPEGFAYVRLDDGFNCLEPADEIEVEQNPGFFVAMAEEARKRYWGRT